MKMQYKKLKGKMEVHNRFKSLILICPSLTTINLPSALSKIPFIASNLFFGCFAILRKITPLAGLFNLKISSPKSLSSLIKTYFFFSANFNNSSSLVLPRTSKEKTALYPACFMMPANFLPVLSSMRNRMFAPNYREYVFSANKPFSVHDSSLNIFFGNVREIFKDFIKCPPFGKPAKYGIYSNPCTPNNRLADHYLGINFNPLDEIIFHKEHQSFSIYKLCA